MRRRRALACRVAGVAALVGSVVLPTTARAADPGSGFGSFSLAANAPAMQVRFNDGDKCAGQPASTGGCEGVVPETVATLHNGPIGYALSSVAWPGVLAGNLGSVVVVAGGPSQATALNDPIRSESRTGAGPDSATNNTVPGVTMATSAKDSIVTAAAAVGQTTSTPVGTVGDTASTSTVQVTGATAAVATATSRADDISLAGGVVHIGQVTSTAKATTDGRSATVAGTTLVHDMTIGGVPVTVDEHGVTVASANAPANTTAAAAVNTAISKAGMTILMSQPMGKPQGGQVTYSTGSLIFLWTTPSGTFSVLFGGVAVQVAAVQGGGFNPSAGGSASTAVTPAGGGSGGATVPGQPGITTLPALTAGAVPAQPAVAGAAPGSVAPALAGQPLPLPGPPPAAYALLGLLGVGLLAAGLRRVPDRLLAMPAAGCPVAGRP